MRRSEATRTAPASSVKKIAARTQAMREGRFARGVRSGGQEDQPRRQADQHVVDERQRMRPFLDEAQAGVDHRGALPQQQRRGRAPRAAARRRVQDGGLPPAQPPSHSATTAMNAGSTITSRDSQEVRHIVDRAPGALRTAEMQERAAERDHEQDERRAPSMFTAKPVRTATPPSVATASATTRPCATPARRREEDDREGGIHRLLRRLRRSFR